LLGFPVIAIVLNVLWQVLIPRDPSLPPLVFHWIPIFGSAAAYGQDPLKFLFECREKYGNIFSFVLLGGTITVGLGTEGNNLVLGGKPSSMSAAAAYTHLTTPVFGKDVVFDLAISPAKFMEQKKFVKVGLTIENFRAYVGMMEDEVEQFIKTDPAFKAYHTGEWGSFDVMDTLAQITVLTASRTLQGAEVRSRLDKTFADLYADLDGGFTSLNFMVPNLPLPSYRKRDRANAKLTEFYIDIIEERRAIPVEDHAQDMITALISQSYRDGVALPDHEIAHLLIALLMAGQHTSSASGSWALLHIASRPDIAEALYQEQVAHFGSPDGSIRSMTYDESRDLSLLDSCIRETLRLHAPIHSVMRKVMEDVAVPATLGTPKGKEDSVYVIPAGHVALCSPAATQVDPRIWSNATEWDPYRWSDPTGVAAREYKEYTEGKVENFGFGAISKGTTSSYLPFGAGRHRCIGEQFAFLQLGTIISTLIRNFEFRLDHAFPETNYHTLIVVPLEPRNITYRRRNEK